MRLIFPTAVIINTAKSLTLINIAVLVTGLLASSQSFSAAKADTHFYGRIHIRLAAIKNQDTSLNNAGHRLGIKGEGVLNNGWDFFYKLESEMNNDDGLGKKDGAGGHTLSEPSAVSSTDLADIVIRHAHAGLSNDYGSVTFGRQSNPLANSYTADVFEANSGSFEQTPFRLGHALIFQTPNDNKVRGYVGAMLEGGGDEEENEQLDGFVVGGQYKLQKLVMHLGFFHADFNSLDTDKSEFSDVSFGLSYQLKNIYLAANAEHSILKAPDGNEVKTDKIDLGLTYTIDTITYGTGYAVQDNGTDRSSRFLIGAYIDLGSNNDCYVELGLLNKEAGDNDNLAMGYLITF
jgi:predicted porin